MSNTTSINKGTKGQYVITIPLAIAKALNIKHKDRFVWSIKSISTPALVITKSK